MSPSDFFYRNREIAGFSNPSRATYTAVRELLENSLDAAESREVPPNIFLRISEVEGQKEAETKFYIMRVEARFKTEPTYERVNIPVVVIK